MKVNFETTAPKTIFEALRKVGHDEDFEGAPGEGFQPTDAEPGTIEKMEVMQRRVELGQPLYHKDDCPLEPVPTPFELQVVSTENWDSRKTKSKRSD